jgi:hypothetical protein
MRSPVQPLILRAIHKDGLDGNVLTCEQKKKAEISLNKENYTMKEAIRELH